MTEQFIGNKKIKIHFLTSETTPGGIPIVEVEYEDGTKEFFSELMFKEIVSDLSCDLTELRDKRISPVVKIVVGVLRDWGIKIGESSYFALVLNQSLNFNIDEAQKELWSQWTNKPLSLDEVDLIAVDRVLKSTRKTIKDVIGK